MSKNSLKSSGSHLENWYKRSWCLIEFRAQNSASRLNLTSKLKNIGFFTFGKVELQDFNN